MAVAVGMTVFVAVGVAFGKAVAVGTDVGVPVGLARRETGNKGSCQLHPAMKTETRSTNLVRELDIID